MVDLMEKGKSGKRLKGGEEAKQPSGEKVPQAEERRSTKALRQESTGLSHSSKEASQAGDTEIRGEEEKWAGGAGQVEIKLLYKKLASTLRIWEPPEDCEQRRKMN